LEHLPCLPLRLLIKEACPAPILEPVEEVCVEMPKSFAEEALRCKIKKNGNEASCWFCDCDDLAEQL